MQSIKVKNFSWAWVNSADSGEYEAKRETPKMDEKKYSGTSKLSKLVFCLFNMINEQGLPLYNDESDFFSHTRWLSS